MALDTLARAMAARADSKAKTAYQYAVEGGYTGTEEQFTEDMGKLGINAEAVDNAVRFDIAQAKTELQKLQAQANIGLDTSDGDINAQLAMRALINGYYSSMGVGLADNLNSNTKIPLTKPYVIRPTADSEDVAGLYKRTHLTGGSLVWNQLFDPITTSITINGTVTVSTSNGKFTFSGTSASAGGRGTALNKTNIDVIANHIYALLTSFDISIFGGIFLTNVSQSSNYYSFVSGNALTLIKPSTSFTGKIGVNLNAREYTESGYFMLLDLTTTFGTTFANAIYSMSDHGVQWLYTTFPELNGGFIPYSAPHFEHSKYKGVTSNGVNQWDEQWELGDINATTGEPVSSSQLIRSKNFCPVLPSVQYYANLAGKNARIFFYDVNENYISYTDRTGNGTFTTPNNAYFFKFRMNTAYGTTYKDDIDFLIHYDTSYDDVHNPYEFWHTDLGSDVLKGIPVADDYTGSNVWSGKWHWEGDTKTPDGVITHNRYEYTITGTESFSATSTGQHIFSASEPIYGYIKTSANNNIVAPIQCEFAVTKSYTDLNVSGDTDGIGLGTYYVIVGSKQYNEWSSYAGKKIYFDAKTPTTSQGTAYDENEQCHNWGIQYVEDAEYDDGNRAFKMPMGGEEVYTPNLTEKVEAMPSAPVANGDYIVRVANNKAEYIPLPNSFPTAPSADGTYSLKCTVSSGTATLSWVADT